MAQPSSFPVLPVDTQKHYVQTKMNYFKRLGDEREPPIIYPFRPETHGPSQWTQSVDATVCDIADEELDYNLDTRGFKIYYHVTKVADFSDMDTIKREYFPEVQQMLKDV
ncbi:hypothetical protein EDB81DRAFT_922236 [Dactylonectria macrodidyma]|uniref:Uncharacterized protein n=1 Tax=Dactylonectria macrodidyma TaxID=307937 RepID=A0A9P9D3U6_9HYPO|nr:hypothetical protein EDB81DRAFT_922236 [Dactylonectria macrodidyma]